MKLLREQSHELSNNMTKMRGSLQSSATNIKANDTYNYQMLVRGYFQMATPHLDRTHLIVPLYRLTELAL